MTQPNRIRFWRQQKGWTLQQLAEAAATTRAQIDKLERGTRRLTVDWMVRLAAPLGCDPRSLMNVTGLAEAAQRPLERPSLPVYALRSKRNCAVRAAATSTAPFLPPQRHAGNTYAVTLPQAWRTQLRGPARWALIQPGAPLKRGGLILLGLPDGVWRCGWFLERSAQTLHWQPLGEKPQRLARAAYAALHPVTALCDGV